MEASTWTPPVPTEMKHLRDSLAEAIRPYQVLELWQIEEIHQALNDADAGDFAPEDEVTDIMQRHALDAA